VLAEEGVPDTGADASDLNALKAAAEVEAARYRPEAGGEARKQP
jgi:hypothetical protein